MTRYYTVIIFLNIAAMLIVQLCISHSNTLTKGRKQLFHKLFTAIIIGAFCEWLGNCLQGAGDATRVLHIMVKATEFSVAPSIGFYTAMIIEKKREKAVYLFLAVHAAMEWLSGIFGFIYSVDADSNYTHGRFYWIYIAAYISSLIYCTIIVIRNVKKYQYNGIGYFLAMAGMMVTGIGIQLYDSSLKVDYATVSMAAVMLYVFTLEMINQTDELTELINRRGYENYISHVEDPSVILFFDVNNFKQINDTYGHAFGDQVLKNIGRAMKEEYARYGKCFRFGGDEFCVIITKNIENIEKMNQSFLEDIARIRSKEERMPEVSIGYVHYNPESQNIRDVVEEADQMMYRNKEAGKKNICHPNL